MQRTLCELSRHVYVMGCVALLLALFLGAGGLPLEVLIKKYACQVKGGGDPERDDCTDGDSAQAVKAKAYARNLPFYLTVAQYLLPFFTVTLVGSLSDRFGRKAVLLITIIGATAATAAAALIPVSRIELLLSVFGCLMLISSPYTSLGMISASVADIPTNIMASQKERHRMLAMTEAFSSSVIRLALTSAASLQTPLDAKGLFGSQLASVFSLLFCWGAHATHGLPYRSVHADGHRCDCQKYRPSAPS